MNTYWLLWYLIPHEFVLIWGHHSSTCSVFIYSHDANHPTRGGISRHRQGQGCLHQSLSLLPRHSLFIFCINLPTDNSRPRPICCPFLSYHGTPNRATIHLSSLDRVPSSNNHGTHQMLVLVIHLHTTHAVIEYRVVYTNIYIIYMNISVPF